jgi:hypothetical protein
MSAKDTGVSLQRDPGVTFNANDLALSIPMVRWSSDPASLGSSASSGFSNVTGNLVNSLRCNVIAMQRQLIAERERCHKLEINQATERSNSDANLKAIVQCVEQGKAENRQLQAAVWKQRREIAKLRRQLHAARTQFSGVNGNGKAPKDSVSDHDGDFSDDEFGLTYYSSFSQEDQRRVTSSWGDLNDVVSNFFIVISFFLLKLYQIVHSCHGCSSDVLTVIILMAKCLNPGVRPIIFLI